VGLHPFRITNPGYLGGKKLRFDSRDLALTAVFSALYVIINIVQMVSVGNPTIYGPIQLRVADCLIALAALLGLPVVGGVTLGCFLTNAYYYIGVQDVILGPVANLIAATVVFLLRKHRFTACVVGALPVGFVVGGYLWIFFPPPEILGTLPVWVAMIASITFSSLIAIVAIGYTLLSILARANVVETLKSRGLRVAADEG
jgi:uncharacterized membrane protein